MMTEEDKQILSALYWKFHNTPQLFYHALDLMTGKNRIDAQEIRKFMHEETIPPDTTAVAGFPRTTLEMKKYTHHQLPDVELFDYSPLTTFRDTDDYHYGVFGSRGVTRDNALEIAIQDFETMVVEHKDFVYQQKAYNEITEDGGLLDVGYVWLIPGNERDYHVGHCSPGIHGALCIGIKPVIDPEEVH